MSLTYKSQLNILLVLSLLALVLSLPLLTSLISKSQDSRSKASTETGEIEEETSNSKLSFKIAFKGVKPSYNCLSSLDQVNLEIVNVSDKTYQSDIETSITPIPNETNKDGDQVFLVSNLFLDSDFSTVNNFNYILVNNQSFLTSRMCLNNQDSKVEKLMACDINLKDSNNTTYDFSNYPLLPGDLNQDGIVNTSDFSQVKTNLDSSSESVCDKQGDINFDGMVNVLDVSYLKQSLLNNADDGVIDITNITPTPTATPIPTATPTPKEIKFAVAADVHNCNTCLEKIMKKSKDDGMQITILAGDLTVDGTQSELENSKKVLDDSGMKYVVTPGNHDGLKNLFNNVFGIGYQSFKINGVKFILIDNSHYRGLDKGTGSTVQQNWIKSELAECKTIICIAIMHRPINHPSSDHVMGEDNSNAASEAKWLKNLLIQSNVREVESGHIHRFETYTYGGIKTNLVGAGQYSRFSEFTVEVTGNISRKQIQL